MNTRLHDRAIRQISVTAADWVARRAAGLSSDDEQALTRWLESDARHQAAFDHHASAFAAFERPQATGRTSAFVQEVELRVRRRRRRVWSAAAAGLAMLLAVAARWPAREPVEPVFNSHPARAVVHKPESRTLPDGSLVELKQGAELSVAFDARSRRVTLHRGSAHFRVIKDASRPFVVAAGGVETRAVGTAFSVQLENSEVEVIVTEGRVAVERRTGPGDQSEELKGSGTGDVIVDVGSRVTVSLAAQAVTPTPVAMVPSEIADRLAWRSPRLEFTDTPLADAVDLMNRQGSAPGDSAAVRLVIDPSSPSLAQEPVSGLFRADNAEAFVRMLEVTLGLQAEHEAGKIVLRRLQRK